VQPAGLASILAEAGPDIVAIDCPPCWAISGRSRLTEKELRAFGIHSYGTPSDPKKADNAFYSWMKVGIKTFEVTEEGGFPRYRNGSPKGKSLEAFPHASAVVLAGCLPPNGIGKQEWRRQVLRANSVRENELRSADQVDAALAALTGLFALHGRFTALGDPREGVIVLPVRTLPAAPYRRSTVPPKLDPQLHLPGLTPCACGDPACKEVTKHEFARGHDAKRKSILWKGARTGEQALEELRRRHWEVPPEIR